MSWQNIKVLLVFIIPLFASACGMLSLPGSQPATTTASSLNVQIASYSESVMLKPFQAGSVSASCKPGEQMIGGGFAASDVFEFDANIDASYPSGVSTWTVAGSSNSHFQLEAEV